MNTEHSMDQVFIKKVIDILEVNLTNEQFGVKELTHEMGISRSQLHRKLIALTQKSTSQFIREYRLEKAMEMLQNDVATASEIAYRVGFNSPTYFNTCFHQYYGFPPGEVKFRDIKTSDNKDIPIKATQSEKKTIISRKVLYSFLGIILLFVISNFVYTFFSGRQTIEATEISIQDKSIAVLPFKNLSDDKTNQYFADGVMDDILNHLSTIKEFKVISRTTMEQYRETRKTAPEIAKELKVSYIIESSIQKYKDSVKIITQLIDAKNDKHIWSKKFGREFKNIFALESEIAKQIAIELKTTLSPSELQQIDKIPTQNIEAYAYYLQARFLLHKSNGVQRSDFDKKTVMNCIKYYEKAIAEDESFAEAYAGLANAWFHLSAWGWLPGGFLKARKLSMKALEIDPECAEAHAILGAFLVWGQRNFEDGGKEYETSIKLNPNFATARQGYAQYLMITGPIEDARKQIDIALELEPYFWVVQNVNAYIYYFEKKYNKAIDACLLARDLKPDFIDNEWLLFLNYTKLGEGEKAVQMLQTIRKHYSGAEQYDVEIIEVYNESGINGLFTWLIDVNTNKPIPVEGMTGHPFFIAWWNAILGNIDESIFWLEKNMESQQRLYAYFNLIATNPDFDILRNDPRFLKIINDIGLTPYHKQNLLEKSVSLSEEDLHKQGS